jgi:hypothetical protein
MKPKEMKDKYLLEYVRALYLKYNLNIECYMKNDDIQVRMNLICEENEPSGVKYCRTFDKDDVINAMLFTSMGVEITQLEKVILKDVSEIRDLKLRSLGI